MNPRGVAPRASETILNVKCDHGTVDNFLYAYSASCWKYAEQPIRTVPGEQDRERVRRGVRTSAKDSEPGEERSEHMTD